MNIKPRYFIKTKDDLFFAVNTYTHPDSHIIAFLRYIPSEEGTRFLDGKYYKKVNSQEAYSYIKKNHPNYLFEWNVVGKQMMGVAVEDIKEVLNPTDCLYEILENKDSNSFYDKIRTLANIFHEHGISYLDMGVTGSTLAHLENSESDIDFIVFGADNHKKARETYEKLKNDPTSPLEVINDEYMQKVYEKRIKDDSMTFEEFKWYELRKNNRGFIDGTLFDILCTMNDGDFVYDDVSYIPLEKMTIKCEICEDLQSYDTPAIYTIDNVEIIEGDIVNIEKLVSYTHTYTGIVKNNERVIASGVCEKVIKKDNQIKYDLVVGTTRESINEYIKLEENPLKK